MYQMAYHARALKGEEWVKRYCLHFLLFYHAGDAARAAEEHWSWSRYEYEFDNLQRGTERRHYRGAQGRNAMARLRGATESPATAFESMVAGNYTSLVHLFTKGPFRGCGFGEYFIWKVLDLQTRVFDHDIELSLDEACQYLPKEPKEAAVHVFPDLSRSQALETVLAHIQSIPLGYRAGYCALQEAETVLCMIKGAFITKTHQIGDDIEDKRKALDGWPELQSLLPAPVLGRYECVGNLTPIK